MKIAPWLFWFTCFLLCCCKQQGKAVEEVKNNTKDTTGSCTICPVDSLQEIKTLLFDALKQHGKDSAYAHFSMFSDSNEIIWVGEIQIGRLFHPNQKAATLAWSVSDTLIDLQVLTEDLGVWIPRFSLQNIPSVKYGIALKDKFLFFRDYNSDGWKDLEVVIESWDGIGFGHLSRLWLWNNTSLRPVKNFNKIYSPELEPETGQIQSYLSGGCSDMAMTFAVWELKSASVHRLRNVSVDCCVGEGPNCLVTVDGKKPKPVPPDQVYLEVPHYFQERLREKMKE